MSKKNFDPTKPHNHYCSACHATFYCCALPCEQAQYIECERCSRGASLEVYKGRVAYVLNKPAPLHQVDYEDDD